jgi:hypothetical protein
MEEEIDLDQVLTPEERRHYEKFLGAGFRITTFVHPHEERPWTWTATSIREDEPSPGRWGEIRAAEQRETRDGLLVKRGSGPDTCSSSQVLALSPEWCWDVCNYYGRLGLHWKATRRQIREALTKSRALVGGGSEYLTYAASQLLNQQIRREYDRCPLGALFLKDKVVVGLLKQAATQAASAMAARGFHQTTPEDILGSWGFSVDPPGGPGGEGEDGQVPASLPPSPYRASPGWANQWGWYYDPQAPESLLSWSEDRMMRWQLLLIREFARRGMNIQFAVGICSAETFSIRPAPDPGILVILLGEGEPTPELAADAADMWGLVRQPKRLGDRYADIRQGSRAG